MKEAV